jgi:steroid delta-isomerase-like uncharacterized protein
MAAEENKKLVREHYQSFFENDAAAIKRQISPDFVDHEAPPGMGRGPESVITWRAMVGRSFPDLRANLDDVVAEGDRVAVRATWHGTHQGEFMGIPPTGRSVAFSGMVFFRISGGQIAERWATLDRLELMKQLQKSSDS